MRLDESNILFKITWATTTTPLNVGHFRIHLWPREGESILNHGTPVWKTLAIYNGTSLLAGPFPAVVTETGIEFYISTANSGAGLVFGPNSLVTLTYQIASCSRPDSAWLEYSECPSDNSPEHISSSRNLRIVGMEWGGQLFDATAITDANTNTRLNVRNDLTVLGLHNNSPFELPVMRSNF